MVDKVLADLDSFFDPQLAVLVEELSERGVELHVRLLHLVQNVVEVDRCLDFFLGRVIEQVFVGVELEIVV